MFNIQEVYAALMLHENGQQVNEENLKKVLQSIGSNVDEAKLKALVASLEGQNIDELIKQAAVTTVAPAQTEAKKEEKAEDTEKASESASAGLSALFG